jgi:hopanoid biosynthesis associated RND transporter like protein HpnN
MRDRFLKGLARLVLNHPRATLLIVGLMLVLAAALIPGLQVQAGHSSLVDQDDPHQARFHSFLSKFGSPNLLFAIVEGGNEGLRRRCLDDLIKRLPRRDSAGAAAPCDPEGSSNHPGCVRDVMGRIDLEKAKTRALLYVPARDLQTLIDMLLAEEGLNLKALRALTGLPAMLKLLAAEIERRAEEPPPTGDERKRAETAMKVLARLFAEIERRVKDPARAELPLEEALIDRPVQSGIDARGYLSSADGELKLAMIRPVNDSDEPTVVVPFVRYVKRQTAAAVLRHAAACKRPGVCAGPLRVRLTGLPAIIADETEIINRDVALTSIVAIVGILALFIFGFRSVRQSVLGLTPLLAGLVLTLAFVHVVFGALNLVTAAFIATLLGLGIDFAVHLLSRFNELRRKGHEVREAAEGAILGAGPGILTGALTTAGAFVALAVNDFLAFSQLGVITGVGLLCVLCTTLTAMPAMLVLPSLRSLHGKVKPAPAGEPARPRLDLPGFIVRHPVTIVVGGLAIAALMLLRAQQIPWSYDYMKLMPANLTSVKSMQTLSERTDFTAGVSAVIAGSIGQARSMAARLKAMPTVQRVESLATFIPDEQERKLKLLQRLRPALEETVERPARATLELAQVKQALQDLADNLEDARFDAKRGGAEEAKLLTKPIEALARLRKTIDKTPAAESTRRLAQLQRLLLDGLDQGIKLLSDNVNATTITVANLVAGMPSGLRDRLYHSKGKGKGAQFAVYVYPARPIWDKDFLERLIVDLRKVSPAATGFPVTHWETSQAIERGFRHAAIVASVVLVLMLLIDFRSPRYALLALAPLAMGIAWMWGGISLLGISYNFVNIIAFPLIIGIGVASGVHILHRYRQEGERDVAPVIQFTGMAVFLSAATTMVGFGSLALAQHQGAASLGLVLLLGVGSCLLTSTLFLPALLQLLRRRDNGKQPPTASSE